MPGEGHGLIGRAEELGMLRRALDAGRNGVIISGPAGVGKSVLAGAFVADQRAAGSPIVMVRGSSSMATIPFGVFAAHVDDAPTHGLGRLEALRRIAAHLLADAGGGRLILGVDDAHLLDEGSAAVVTHLVEFGGAFVVATLRSGEPGAARANFADGRAIERLALQPLGRADFDELLTALVNARPTAATSARLWDWTRGNPLFAHELVRIARARDALVIEHDNWVWKGRPQVDAELRDIVLERWHETPEAEREVLELLSVGEPLDVDVLVGICGDAAVFQAERSGLLVTDDVHGSLRARMFHPLYTEVLASTLPPLRRRQLCSVLADAVNESPSGTEELLRVAAWWLEAGTPALDPQVLVAASQRALGNADYELAERLAAAAQREGAVVDGALALAEALYWQGRFAEVDELLARPLELTDGGRTARAAVIRSSALFWGLDRAAAANDALDAAARIVGDGPEAFDLVAQHASLSFFGGHTNEAVALASTVLGEPAAGPEAKLRALVSASVSWAIQGKWSAAVGAAEVGLPAALARPDLFEVAGELLLSRCLANALAGDLTSAEEIAAMVHHTVATEGAIDHTGSWELFLGRIALGRGRLNTAVALLGNAVLGLRHNDPGGFMPWAYATLAEAEALRGRVSNARGAMAAADSALTTAIRVYDCEVERARAWTLAAGGERSAALAHARRSAQLATEGGIHAGVALAWHAVARLGDPGAAVAELDRLVGVVEGPLVAAYRDHSAALCDDDGDRLEAVSRAFEQTGSCLLALEAGVEAVAAHRRAGRRGSALRAQATSERLSQLCEGASLPLHAPVDSDLPLLDLTNREREVIELAARGLANREIADKLRVSIRTVNNHLNHAYAKLGTSNRTELGTLLRF